METSRTKLRREVREKRLAYFEKSQSSHQPKVQEEESPYHETNQAHGLSKNSSRDWSKIGRDVKRKDKSTRHRMQQDGYSGREDRLTASALSSRSGRPTSARSARPMYPQGPSGDDCKNVVPVQRKKTRPSSAISSSHGDHYRLDIADSTRLTGSSLRPFSAKASARPKRPLKERGDPDNHKLSERPSTATAYRSSAESARRHSEFEDFRKGARTSSHYTDNKEAESKRGRNDKELQEFFRLREIRQRSGRDLSPSSSESGQDAGGTEAYNFFRTEAKSRYQALGSRAEPNLMKDKAYEGRSQSLEDGISRRVQSQWGPQVDNEALMASEFHSAYSAENMLQSLLGIRKVKAKLHDELLSSFLENDSYKSILMQKRKSARRHKEELHKQRVPDLNGNEAEIDSALLNDHLPKSEEWNKQGGESIYEHKQEEILSQLPAASINASAYNVTHEENQPDVSFHVESMATSGRIDVNGSASSTKDEGEESGVEMDDLNFDVGALCNAAKQGDDILRQYIRGLTEKVKAKKSTEILPDDTISEQTPAKSAANIESLFAPKMPERKYDVKITNASVSEQATVPPPAAIQSSRPSVCDPMKEKEMESVFDKDGFNSPKEPSYEGLDRIDDGRYSILSPKLNAKDSSDYRDFAGSSASYSALKETTSDQDNSVHQGNKERELDEKPSIVQESLQDDNGSVVSRVKEPAVTADLLEKLGLFDSNDTPYSTSSLKDKGEASIGLISHGADSSTDDVGFQLANGTLDDSDLGLETFRPDSRTISPLKEVRDYSKEGVLTTSHVDSPDLIEEFLDDPSKIPSRAETAALRRTYDLSEDAVTGDIADPNVNTPFHSHIQHSKSGVSFIFNPRSEEYALRAVVANAEIETSLQPEQLQRKPKNGIAFEVDLATARKQPKPPPSSKPINSRVMTSSKGSPKHTRSGPRKSPRTPDAHRDEVRQYHEKNRRMRKLSSPRATGTPVRNVASETSSTSENQVSLRLNLPTNMDTDRPSVQGADLQADLRDSISEVEFGAPFLHSPRREAPLEDEDEVLDRIASFNPPGTSSNADLEAAESQDTVNEIFGQHQVNFREGVGQDGRDTREQRQDNHQASRPRPSSANPKRTATKKPGNSRPTSAHSKMYSSPDKSYDRKWPQSSMAWMTQHKLTSSLIGGDRPDSDLTASGSKVKIGQTRVNREFAKRGKPPVAVQMSKRDGEFVRVRSSKLFDGSVSRVLDGRGSAAVPPLTLQLIQDSPRGSESLSIWQLLPDEILLHIFSYLPQYMLVPCALTCQRFHRIAMDDSLWRTIRLENRDLTDFYLTHIGEKHPVSLTFHKCRGNLITENGLRNLFRSCADSLQELNITGCSKGELQGDSILLHVSRCYNLISLDASWCAVTDNGLSAILDGCPRLETICLNGCQSVSDQCLRQIVNKYGPNLEVLELCGCFNLSPQTLIHLAETSTQLLTLNIAQCYKISDDCVASVAPKFKSLQHWQLKGCKELRDSAVKKIARHCKNLRTLSIASCPHITDMSLIEIATYLNTIRSLDVSGCRKVGNEGMRCLATCCPALEKVGLSSTSVTHKSVSSLASYASQTLMELKLNCCREITEASIIRLLKHCKRLKTLHLYGVKGLRNLGILKVQYPCIEYLEKVRQV